MDLYLGIGVLLGILTIIDGSRRKMGWTAIIWGLIVVVFWPVARGLYHVSKPLFAGETREGGAVWQVVRSMILWWTVLMAVLSISSLTGAATGSYATASSGAGIIGTTIGLGLGAGMFFMVWLVVVIILFVVSLAVKSNIVVQGPTGPLSHHGQGIATPPVTVNVGAAISSNVTPLSHPNSQTQQQLARVWAAYKSGDRNKAKSTLQPIYRQHPNDPDVLYMVSFLADGVDKQIQSLERALTLNPAHELARKRLSELKHNSTFNADLL